MREDKEQVEDQTGMMTKTDDSILEETASDSNNVIGVKEENDCMKDNCHSIGKACFSESIVNYNISNNVIISISLLLILLPVSSFLLL